MIKQAYIYIHMYYTYTDGIGTLRSLQEIHFEQVSELFPINMAHTLPIKLHQTTVR